jgi:hypothetical protein
MLLFFFHQGGGMLKGATSVCSSVAIGNHILLTRVTL